MKIGLAGIAPLYALGLSAVIHELGEETVIINPEENEAEVNSCDRFIVSATALAAYAPLFMPRLSSMLLLSTSPKIKHSLLPTLSPLAPLSEIHHSIATLIKADASSHQHDNPHAHSHNRPDNRLQESKQLTERELQVLKLTAHGKAVKEIAAELSISVNTVLTHKKHISEKLDIHSAPAIVYYALKHKLI